MQEPLVDIGATDTLKVPIERVLDGQLFIVRQAFQQLGLFDLLEQKSLEGVRQSARDRDPLAAVAEHPRPRGPHRHRQTFASGARGGS